MVRISRLATELYGLMEHGTTIDLMLPDQRPPNNIMIKPNRLIVTKPGDHVVINTKLGRVARVAAVTTRRNK